MARRCETCAQRSATLHRATQCGTIAGFVLPLFLVCSFLMLAQSYLCVLSSLGEPLLDAVLSMFDMCAVTVRDSGLAQHFEVVDALWTYLRTDLMFDIARSLEFGQTYTYVSASASYYASYLARLLGALALLIRPCVSVVSACMSSILSLFTVSLTCDLRMSVFPLAFVCFPALVLGEYFM